MDPNGSFHSLADWLAWLETLSPREIDLGLDRVDAVLGRLSPDLPQQVIHIAGTNGKGSSVAMLESLLSTTGVSVGSYTSPHVFDYNERIRIDGKPAGDTEIMTAFETVEAARKGVPLTYFEYGTLAAMQIFSDRDCDVAVLEVGMGGRLDAVNAFDAQASLITNVALDHCDWLGNDVEAIAREKAGVMRPGRPVVFGSDDRPAAIDQSAAAAGARLICAGADFTHEIGDGTRWSWRGVGRSLDHLMAPALAGRFQIGNASAVLALVESLGLQSILTNKVVDAALGGLMLPGRFQRIGGAPAWILDVAHNPHAAGVLSKALAETAMTASLSAVIGALDDKDAEGIVEPLLKHVDAWIAVTAAAPRAIDAALLAPRIATMSGKPCLVATGVESALAFAEQSTQRDGSILVTGSFHVVGPALEWIRRRLAE